MSDLLGIRTALESGAIVGVVLFLHLMLFPDSDERRGLLIAITCVLIRVAYVAWVGKGQK